MYSHPLLCTALSIRTWAWISRTPLYGQFFQLVRIVPYRPVLVVVDGFLAVRAQQ
jgi:hypothetical protein